MTFDVERRDLGQGPLGYSDCISRVHDPVQQNREFVSAQAGDCGACRDTVRQPARNGDQQLVTSQVSQTVVDQLEAVQVEKEYSEGMAGRLAALDDVPGQSVDEQAPIRETGERIVVGAVLELQLGTFAVCN